MAYSGPGDLVEVSTTSLVGDEGGEGIEGVTRSRTPESSMAQQCDAGSNRRSREPIASACDGCSGDVWTVGKWGARGALASTGEHGGGGQDVGHMELERATLTSRGSRGVNGDRRGPNAGERNAHRTGPRRELRCPSRARKVASESADSAARGRHSSDRSHCGAQQRKVARCSWRLPRKTGLVPLQGECWQRPRLGLPWRMWSRRDN